MPSVATQTERERPFTTSAMLLRSLAEGLLIVDLGGVVRQINPAAERLLAVDAQVALDCELEKLPGGAELHEYIATQPGTIEIAGRTIGFEKRSLLGDDQAVAGTVFVLRDRTAELARQRQQYDFFCRALHDVRVPLQAIGGAAEGLQRGWFGPLNDEQGEFVGIVRENAKHQGELFSQLYDAYALATHFVGVFPEPINLDGVFQEVEQTFTERFAAREQSFAIELPAGLPPVLADHQRLRQMLIALLDNARRYTHPGGAVRLRAQLAGNAIVLEVHDTGVGIRVDEQPNIFTPFFRGDNPLKEGRYGGLSLTIAKLLAELHGGQIWFTSAEGQGSTFSFTIPLA